MHTYLQYSDLSAPNESLTLSGSSADFREHLVIFLAGPPPVLTGAVIVRDSGRYVKPLQGIAGEGEGLHCTHMKGLRGKQFVAAVKACAAVTENCCQGYWVTKVNKYYYAISAINK